MVHLIIGGRGLVGSALCREMTRRELQWRSTSRHGHDPWRGSQYGTEYLDLAHLPDDTSEYPAPANFIYLVAANAKLAECERDPLAWRVNVDAPIALARYYHYGSHIIYISSDAVETCSGTAYGRQKAAAETYMQVVNATIVRPSRIPPERAEEFAGFVIDAALKLRSGVLRWSVNTRPRAVEGQREENERALARLLNSDLTATGGGNNRFKAGGIIY